LVAGFFATPGAGQAAPDQALVQLCRRYANWQQQIEALAVAADLPPGLEPPSGLLRRLERLDNACEALLPWIGELRARGLARYRAKAGVLLFQFGLRKDGMALPQDDDFVAWSLCRDLLAGFAGAM
jgi:hypothetical protein